MSREDDNEKIVAILHDVVEDSEVTLEVLKNEGFSEIILEAVDCLTRRNNESYMDFIKRCKQNEIARVVKIEDLLDNSDLSRIPNPSKKDFERVKKYEQALKELE